MRALLLPAVGVLLTLAGISQSRIHRNPALARQLAADANGLQVAWAGFVYLSDDIEIYDVFGGGCPTPDYLPGRIGFGIHNRGVTQIAEGVRVRITLHDASGASIDEGVQEIPQVLAGEEHAAVFVAWVAKNREKIIGAEEEIVSIDAWRPGVPLTMPAVRVSQPVPRFSDPTTPPGGRLQPPDPCNRASMANAVSCSVTNPTDRALVNITVVVVALDSMGKSLGFGSRQVEYLAPGAAKSCDTGWSGPILRVAPLKAYANYPWNNPPPLQPQGSP